MIKKTLKEMGTEGTYLNVIMTMYEKPIANIILNGEKLKAFPLRSGMREECPLFTTFIQHGFIIPCHRNQRRKRNKRNPNRKGKSKTVTICR